jgi:hypothetical protein
MPILFINDVSIHRLIVLARAFFSQLYAKNVLAVGSCLCQSQMIMTGFIIREFTPHNIKFIQSGEFCLWSRRQECH